MFLYYLQIVSKSTVNSSSLPPPSPKLSEVPSVRIAIKHLDGTISNKNINIG